MNSQDSGKILSLSYLFQEPNWGSGDKAVRKFRF